jgi:hypothetical protein
MSRSKLPGFLHQGGLTLLFLKRLPVKRYLYKVNYTYSLGVCYPYTDKKENKIFFVYKEIQMGSGAKSYMRKGFLIYEEIRKFFPIYEEAVSHI